MTNDVYEMYAFFFLDVTIDLLVFNIGLIVYNIIGTF